MLSNLLCGQLLTTYCPHWHACVVGPPLPGVEAVDVGAGERVTLLQLDLACGPDRDAAEAAVWELVEDVCRQARVDFERYEWSLPHPLVIRNGN